MWYCFPIPMTEHLTCIGFQIIDDGSSVVLPSGSSDKSSVAKVKFEGRIQKYFVCLCAWMIWFFLGLGQCYYHIRLGKYLTNVFFWGDLFLFGGKKKPWLQCSYFHCPWIIFVTLTLVELLLLTYMQFVINYKCFSRAKCIGQS